MLCVAPPLHTAALALVTEDALPVALAAHFVMGRAALPRDVLDALFAERVEALGKHGAGPVSYTHLTLPTICSV